MIFLRINLSNVVQFKHLNSIKANFNSGGVGELYRLKIGDGGRQCPRVPPYFDPGSKQCLASPTCWPCCMTTLPSSQQIQVIPKVQVQRDTVISWSILNFSLPNVLAQSVGYFQRRLFVCLCVCQHDNFRTYDDDTWEQMYRTKISAEFDLGVIAPWGRTPKMWRWATTLVKISAGCLVLADQNVVCTSCPITGVAPEMAKLLASTGGRMICLLLKHLFDIRYCGAVPECHKIKRVGYSQCSRKCVQQLKKT